MCAPAIPTFHSYRAVQIGPGELDGWEDEPAPSPSEAEMVKSRLRSLAEEIRRIDHEPVTKRLKCPMDLRRALSFSGASVKSARILSPLTITRRRR